jgi:hypothetical protein
MLFFSRRKEFFIHLQLGVIIQLIRAKIPNMHLSATEINV